LHSGGFVSSGAKLGANKAKNVPIVMLHHTNLAKVTKEVVPTQVFGLSNLLLEMLSTGFR